jgi:hypothetical protein
MKFKHISAIVLLNLMAVLFLWGGAAGVTTAGELKLEAQLIWGANDEKSPDPTHKPVDAEVAKKLKSLPFKWKNYFEVKRQQFVVPQGKTIRVAMSKDCEISVRNLGNSVVELELLGKGQSAGKITQALPKGQLLVTGGNAANLTAWFVVLRQVE